MLDIEQIEKVLPHRYPFLMVDRIIEIEEGKRIVGLKNVTRNEEMFNGHYPEHPIMPGVMIVEAMAQVAGYGILEAVDNKDSIPYFAGIDHARFRKPVVPGDQMRIAIDILKLKVRIAKAKGEVTVDDEIVAEASLMFALSPLENK